MISALSDSDWEITEASAVFTLTARLLDLQFCGYGDFRCPFLNPTNVEN